MQIQTDLPGRLQSRSGDQSAALHEAVRSRKPLFSLHQPVLEDISLQYSPPRRKINASSFPDSDSPKVRLGTSLPFSARLTRPTCPVCRQQPDLGQGSLPNIGCELSPDLCRPAQHIDLLACQQPSTRWTRPTCMFGRQQPNLGQGSLPPGAWSPKLGFEQSPGPVRPGQR